MSIENDQIKIGATASLASILSLLPDDKVYLELEAEGQGGLINSDWFVLKFSGYQRDAEISVTSCQVNEKSQFVNCINDNRAESISVNEGIVKLKEPGFYTVTFTADVDPNCDNFVRIIEDISSRFVFKTESLSKKIGYCYIFQLRSKFWLRLVLEPFWCLC